MEKMLFFSKLLLLFLDFLYAITNKECVNKFMNVFQVVLKGDNSTQLVQDDQVKGPLRVCILHAIYCLIS